MQLNEMQSRLLNQSLDDTGQLGRVANIEETINDPTFQNMDEARQNQILLKSVKRLTQCIKASEQKKTLLTKQKAELESEIERNKQFNEETQENFRNSQEQLLYYQDTLYELLENTGMLQGICNSE